MRILIIFSILLLASCASNKHIGKNTSIQVDSQKIKLNDTILKTQAWLNEKELYLYGNHKYNSKGLYHNLRSCYYRSVKKKVPFTFKEFKKHSVERFSQSYYKWIVQNNENKKLKVVQVEYLQEKVDKLNAFKNKYEERIKSYSYALKDCEMQIAK